MLVREQEAPIVIIVQILDMHDNFPIPLDKNPANMWAGSTLSPNACYDLSGTLLTWLDCSLRASTSGYFRSAADVLTGTKTIQETLDNAPASFVQGLVMQFTTQGEPEKHYNYMCTRNNNFSNRSQKGTLVVHNSAAS